MVELPEIKGEFVREYGAHNFELADHLWLTVISEPTFGDFLVTLKGADIPRNGTVLTPGLITSPELSADLSARFGLIDRRIIEVQQASIRRPDLKILLGTVVKKAAPNNGIVQDEPAQMSAIAAIKDFNRIGNYGHQPLGRGKTASPILELSEGTYVMSSSSGAQLDKLGPPKMVDKVARQSVRWLFSTHPEMNELIIADRVVSCGDSRPFNGHFQRI